MAHCCPACRDLEYHLLDFGAGSGADPASPRYRAIEFPSLRAAAEAGCLNCMILDKASFLFWGSNPEVNKYPRNSLLLLQVRPGKSLRALRADGEDPQSTLQTEIGLLIELFTQEGQECVHPAFGYASCVPRHLSDDATAHSLSSWLSICDQTHDTCKASQAKLPKRILDISTDTTRLVEFNSYEDIPYGKYVTLSHCWGNSGESTPAKTTKSNLEARKRGIPSDDLSTCFRDAIKLCKNVGCDYIWIDSLCIIQDDDLDWRTQSQQMAEVYSSAHFNIAATSSRNGSQGLFQDRWTLGGNEAPYPVLAYNLRIPSIPTDSLYVRVAHERDHRYVRGVMPNLRWVQAPLMERAWVLQEVLLSRRNLHVCASELIWECKALYACECGDVGSGAALSNFRMSQHPSRKQEIIRIQDGRHKRQEILDFWLRVCQQYSTLRLTKASDRAAALMGLVKTLQVALNGTYLGGIWIEDLPRALLWCGIARSTFEARRCIDAPTWSWLSRRLLTGSCPFFYEHVIDDFRQSSKSSVVVVTTGANRSTVVYRGPVTPGILLKEVRLGDHQPEFYLRVNSLPFRFLMSVDCPAAPEDNIYNGDMLICLLIGNNGGNTIEHVLVVKAEADGTSYRRVGVSEFKVGREAFGGRHSYFDDRVQQINII